MTRIELEAYTAIKRIAQELERFNNNFEKAFLNENTTNS